MYQLAKKSILFLFGLLILSVLFVVFDSVFSLIRPPQIVSTDPPNGIQDISLDKSLTITFDKPVMRREIKISFLPQVLGELVFENPSAGNHLYKSVRFTPAGELKPDTEYQVTVENIKGFVLGQARRAVFSFKTAVLKNPEPEPQETILQVPFYWQQHALSCEASSLRMALAWKGVLVSEEEIMAKVGFDSTSRSGDKWGDPYKAFVGNIDGKMCVTGYGVFGAPIEKAAKNWRPAESFSNWEIQDVTREIRQGNAIVMFGHMPTGNLTDCSWYTPDGKFIKAYRQDHVRTIIGFIGPSDNPTKIVFNDPLKGKLYWSTAYFLKNWERSNFSGVVVR